MFTFFTVRTDISKVFLNHGRRDYFEVDENFSEGLKFFEGFTCLRGGVNVSHFYSNVLKILEEKITNYIHIKTGESHQKPPFYLTKYVNHQI